MRTSAPDAADSAPRNNQPICAQCRTSKRVGAKRSEWAIHQQDWRDQAKATTHAKGKTLSYTLLTVDDDPSLRRLLEVLVTEDPRFGEPLTAANAHEALGMAAQQPDVIVLDANLGFDDGLELIPRLREVAPSAVVAVFSSAPVANPDSAHRAGADVFVEKGTDPDRLLDLVASLVQHRTERTSRPLTIDLREQVSDRAQTDTPSL